MVNRIVVGAHYGLRDWIVQRMTAVLMLVYVAVFFLQVLTGPPLDFATWRMIFTPQWMKFATLLFLCSLYLHAWIGVRDIVMDYVKHTGVQARALHGFYRCVAGLCGVVSQNFVGNIDVDHQKAI